MKAYATSSVLSIGVVVNGQEMLDTGKRALGGTLAGIAWIAWALTTTDNIALAVRAVLVLYGSLLLGCCAYCIWKGWRLQELQAAPRRGLNRGFLALCVLEGAGVAGAISVAEKTNRVEALPAWIGLVIGLHFFGLAKVFRTPVYHVSGVAITLWCLYAWCQFHGEALTIAAGFGVGLILWGTSSFNLARVLASARR